MKCKQLRPGFELESPIPILIMMTNTLCTPLVVKSRKLTILIEKIVKQIEKNSSLPNPRLDMWKNNFRSGNFKNTF